MIPPPSRTCASSMRGRGHSWRCKPKPPKIPPTTNFPVFDGWHWLRGRSGSSIGPGPGVTDFPYFNLNMESPRRPAQSRRQCNNQSAWKRLPEFSAVWAYTPVFARVRSSLFSVLQCCPLVRRACRYFHLGKACQGPGGRGAGLPGHGGVGGAGPAGDARRARRGLPRNGRDS
jgi:hypothetical protein